MPVRPVMPSDAPDHRSDESNLYQLELHRRMQSGDLKAREMLILYQMPLAITLATSYMQKLRRVHIGVTREDIEQVAFLGLMQAVDDWNPQRAFLAGWSKTYIFREVSDFLRTTARRRPISKEKQQRLAQIHGVVASYEHAHGAIPTPRQIAQELNLTDDQVVSALRSQQVSVFDEAEQLGHLVGTMGLPEAEYFRGSYFREYAKARIHQMIGELSEARQEAVRLRFGLDDSGEPHTLEEEALAMHTSCQAAGQKVKKSLEYLKSHYADELLEIKDALAA